MWQYGRMWVSENPYSRVFYAVKLLQNLEKIWEKFWQSHVSEIKTHF